MRSSLVISIVLSLAARTLGWNHVDEAGLRSALDANENALVAFVFGSQDASKALESQWMPIQERETAAQVVSVDCAAHPRLCQEYDVASFPAIRLYRDHGTRLERYRGPRKTPSIAGFLQREMRPAVSVVSDKNATSFRSIDDVVVVAHVRPQDANLYDRFAALARHYRDRCSFGVAWEARDAHERPALACYHNVDDVQHATAELGTVGALEAFLQRCVEPVIPELTRRNEWQYMSSGKSIVHYFVSSDKQRDEYVQEMRPLAKKYREYLLFTTTDTNEYPETLPMFGHRLGSSGVLSVRNPSTGDVYPYRGTAEISAGVVEAFLVDIIHGRVRPWTDEPSPSADGSSKHDEL